ncbi:plasmid stabilization system protein ParE [Bradyrhizobium sp. S3.9.2]
MPKSEDMTRCIELCLGCYRTCHGMAMNHCLETGGTHVEPRHFRLMMACAEIWRTAAHFMLINTPHHGHTCGECAGDLRRMRPGLRTDWRHGRMRRHVPVVRRILPRHGCLRMMAA